NLYERGDEVPKNKLESNRWMVIAAHHAQLQTSTTTTNSSLAASVRTAAAATADHRPHPSLIKSLGKLIYLMLRSPRLALRLGPLLLLLLGVPLLILILFVWMLATGSEEPQPTPISLRARGFRSEDAIRVGWRLMRHNAGFFVALCSLYAFLIIVVNYALKFT